MSLYGDDRERVFFYQKRILKYFYWLRKNDLFFFLSVSHTSIHIELQTKRRNVLFLGKKIIDKSYGNDI